MKRLTLRILPAAAAVVALAGGMAITTPKACATQTLLWSDEFNGTSINTSTWTVYNQADGSKSWYSPTNMSESGGELRIANVEIGTGDQWAGGGMESKSEFPQYCYLESRVKFSIKGSYDWGTWWTVGESGGSFVWPPEMDICEFQGGPAATNGPGQTYWWNWSGSGNADAGSSTYVDESQWHTYGVYWNTNCSPLFYVDGILSGAPVGPYEGNFYGAILKFTSSPNSYTRVSGCPLTVMEADYCRVYDNPPDQPAHVSHLALNKPVIASSYKNTGGIPDRAVDGLDSSGTVTRWESNWEDPQWLCVDLQAVCSINKVILNWQYAAGASYQLQVSSDSWGPWTNCISVTGGTYGWVTNTFAAQTGRYVRIYGTARTTPYGYSLYDMQVFGTVINSSPGAPPARPNLALNKPTTVSSYQTNSPSCPGSYAVDGDLNTRWASAWSDPQWIYVDLGSTTAVDTVSIYWEAGAAKAYQVLVGNNPNSLTAVYTTTNSSAGWKNIQFPSQNARYVKINGTARTTSYGYSIWELQVYGGAATNSGGGGGTVPSAPTGLTPTVVSSNQINLTWNASTGATSYNVKRSTTSGGSYTTIGSGVTATSYSDTGLTPATTYYYVVSAVNSVGEGTNSLPVSATTQPIGGGGTDLLLSQGKSVTASSSQSGYPATNGNDGSMSSRWSASSSSYPQWWRVDLGASHTLHTVIVDWLNPTSRAYNYTIDVSADGTNYTTVVTATNRVSGKIYGNTTNSISVTDRYVRVNVTGASGGNASFYECQVMGQ